MRLALFLLVTLAAAAGAQFPDFSGTWKQVNEECTPRRIGDVTLRIQQRDWELVVETISGRTGRHALQRYTTDGVESVSTGADGDEFHSIAIWKDDQLVFDIVEIEDGKRLKLSEIWSIVNGTRIKRVRRGEKHGDQTLIYKREKSH